MKIFISIFLAAFSSALWALPAQLNVAGIIPDVTTKQEIETLENTGGIVIGGYKLICLREYGQDQVLFEMSCLTGKSYLSLDTTKGSDRIATNMEIHETLVKGYIAKFGNPVEDETVPVTTALGATYQSNTSVWRDQLGNKLTLVSRAKKIGEGLLHMISARKIRQNAESKKESDAKRTF